LFGSGADRDLLLAALHGRLGGGRPDRVRWREVGDRDWARAWMDRFRPMRFGRRLWICPGGLPAGEPDAVRLELDPGLAFGTGTHPTTAMCLEWLDSQALAGRRVVDYGCGSGILGLAALKLGAASVLAVDLDPQALLATRENAARNGLEAGLTVSEELNLAPDCADILVANILAGPLIELAPGLAAAVRPGGEIALSGVLEAQAAAVTAAYRPWFHIGPFVLREGWTLISGRRRAP
jgi:ribosomal protein L11 methyltransferase